MTINHVPPFSFRGQVQPMLIASFATLNSLKLLVWQLEWHPAYRNLLRLHTQRFAFWET